MQFVIPGQANYITLPLVARASGAPITAGTVNLYLKALDGTNAGKWYQGSDTSWQASEAIASAGTHQADGHWGASLASGAWTNGVRYLLYAKESGNLHIPVEDAVLCSVPQTSDYGAAVDGVTRANWEIAVLAAAAGKTVATDNGTTVVKQLYKQNGSTLLLTETYTRSTLTTTVVWA